MSKHSALRKEQPPVVKRAIAEGDNSLLSKLGRKGGIQAGENREARKAFQDEIAERHLLSEDEKLRQATNEHIVPLDSDDERDAA